MKEKNTKKNIMAGVVTVLQEPVRGFYTDKSLCVAAISATLLIAMLTHEMQGRITYLTNTYFCYAYSRFGVSSPLCCVLTNRCTGTYNSLPP